MRLRPILRTAVLAAFFFHGAARAIDFRLLSRGQEILETQEVTKAKKLPPLLVTVPIPADLAESPEILTACGMTAIRGTASVRRLRGRATAYLDHADLRRDTVERAKIGTARFRTGADGRDNFLLEVDPAALPPPAGGDKVASWVTWVVRADNGKKVDLFSALCTLGAAQ